VLSMGNKSSWEKDRERRQKKNDAKGPSLKQMEKYKRQRDDEKKKRQRDDEKKKATDQDDKKKKDYRETIFDDKRTEEMKNSCIKSKL